MTSSGQTESVSSGFHALIVWFARNHVAANLLMLAVIASGLLVSRQIRQEIYPTFTLDVVEISMEYRGASPEDIEKSILLPIESELRTMEIIREITATASEGSARVQAELVPGSDRNRGLQEITAAIQRINLFPDEAEPPIIALDNGRRRGVMYLSIYGDLSTRGLVQFAREMEERLLSLPDISLVELRGIRKPEIHIEVPQANLRSLGLRLSDIATAVDNAALDVPAGSIKTEAGDYLLKTR
ncbi:MAG: efflux RND transporter permease subunit, partial [Limisphaerales bacterium]